MTAAPGCIVHTQLWRNGIVEKLDFPLTELSEHLDEPDCLVWADIEAPDAAMLATLGDELGLDQHAVEDAVADHERPKAVRYRTHTFVTTYALGHVDDDVCAVRVSAFVLPRGLVTVRLTDGFDMGEVARRWENSADLLKFGTKALVHGLLDTVVDGYLDLIESFDDRVDDLETRLFENWPSSAGVQEETFHLRRSLIRARRVIQPTRDVVAKVTHGILDSNADGELVPYYEDLTDHIVHVSEWTDGLRDRVSSVFETTMSASDVRMNLIMKKLTSWAAIIAVPTAVTGFFGQNVPYPGFGHWSGFIASTAIMVVIALALYVTFKIKDWL
jgi:magnesium transporter